MLPRIALLTALLPSTAMAQSLVGDDITIRPFQFFSTHTFTVIEPGVDVPNAGPTLGFAGSTGRLDIDFTADSLRIDMTAEQDLGGPGDFLTFSGIEPICPDGQIGTINNVTVTTNIDPNRQYPDALGNITQPWMGDFSFTDDTLVIEHHAQIRYLVGEFMEFDFDFSCPGLTLTFDGACPGVVDVDVAGMTPGGQLAVVRGTGLGSTVVPVGPCAGTILDVTGANLVTFVNDNDNDGLISASPTLNQNFCNIPIQVVDMTTCETSNVAFP